MKPLLILAASAAGALASLAAAAPASAHCGCAPRHPVHYGVRHHVVRRAERVVYVPVPGPERVVREPVYVPGPERVIREPVYVQGPTRVVREPIYQPPVVVRERAWRSGPVYPLSVHDGWDRGYREHEGWREHDGWREHARDHDEGFRDHERGWR